jgi:hypothetical protein
MQFLSARILKFIYAADVLKDGTTVLVLDTRELTVTSADVVDESGSLQSLPFELKDKHECKFTLF